jgi:uracil phosphoribosyltransferase
MLHNLSTQNSIANQFIAELRDAEIQKDRRRFRQNVTRLGEIFAYEISKTFTYKKEERETPLGIATVEIPQNDIVIACVLRAGLPLHKGLLNYFDEADNAFVAAYRRNHKDGSFEINMEYITCPNLENKTLILADAMIATGASVEAVLNEMEKHGIAEKIHVITIIGSTQGVNYIRRVFPDVDIWCGAIDEELTAKSYIVPGLGDAGDLLFGEKLQE